MELFPDIGVQMGQLTVVSISQHTENDMSAWSPDVEEERESLMSSVRLTRENKNLTLIPCLFLSLSTGISES